MRKDLSRTKSPTNTFCHEAIGSSRPASQPFRVGILANFTGDLILARDRIEANVRLVQKMGAESHLAALLSALRVDDTEAGRT